MKMKKPSLSIVIPAKNEEKCLPRLLESIKAQSYKDYEVIVVDDGSKDKTSEIAKSFGCRVIRVIRSGPGNTRNRGAKLSRGNMLLFLDADSMLPAFFLKNCVTEIRERKLSSGTVSIVPLSNKLVDRLFYLFYNSWQKAVQYFDPHAVGVCIFINKNLFDKLNGFDLGVTFAEDHDLVRRSRKFGKFRVINSAKIYNDVRRFDKEGRLKVAVIMIYALFHRTFFGEFRRKEKLIWEAGDIEKK